MTDVQFSMIMGALERIERQVDPTRWNNPLIGGIGTAPQAPTDSAQNPGKYYGTQYDPLSGYETSTTVIEKFSPPIDDGEGGRMWKFVGGTLYDWAKADLYGFMRYYQDRYKVPLVISRLHPEQVKRIGL